MWQAHTIASAYAASPRFALCAAQVQDPYNVDVVPLQDSFWGVWWDHSILWGTGRIGSRQQLAENAWLVSLGCSGGTQWPCRVHLLIFQLGFKGKPILLKIGRFSLYACGNGVDLPHLAKRAFRDQIGPNVQKAMLLGSPSQSAENLWIFSKIFFSFFDLF